DMLAQNIGIGVTRDIILDRIWGLESDVSSNNIDSYMKMLRKKLDAASEGEAIKTIRGVGYKLEASH
uniref:helix-turn-helix domain-containing protein n=1 Tax=Selenomonas artemidis TaxID=671224 RepID=UPI002889DAB2